MDVMKYKNQFFHTLLRLRQRQPRMPTHAGQLLFTKPS